MIEACGRPWARNWQIEFVQVALVAVGALFTLGEAVGGPFSEVSDAIADALGGGEGDSL